MNHLRNSMVFFILLLWSCMALAAATVVMVNGEVTMASAQALPSQLAVGQRVEAGAMIETGSSSNISLRFDDGQMLALSPNSSFIVNEYKFTPHKPEESSFIGSLLKGGLRAVTGIIGEKNKNNVNFKVEVATIGIRGTDFALHYDGELHLAVREGVIFAKNDGGEEVFDANLHPYGKVVSAKAKPRHISEDQIPADALGVFRVLQRYPLSNTIWNPNQDDPSCEDRR